MRTLPVVLGPLIVVAAVAGAGVVLLRAGDPERLAVAPPAPHTQVVRDGDRVSASGSVVSVPGRPVRFCAPVAQDAIGYAPGQEPAPAYCPFGVDVEAVDLADLADRCEKDGSLEGQTALTGVWRDGKLVVQEQGPPAPDSVSSRSSSAPPASEVVVRRVDDGRARCTHRHRTVTWVRANRLRCSVAGRSHPPGTAPHRGAEP